MAGLSPAAVGGILGFLCIFTTYTYFFQIPTALRAKSSAKGVWGEPDGEFNWCELDYQLTELIAEPTNTATGIVYILVGVCAWWWHCGHFQLETRMLLNLTVVAMIGVGTVLFHATLRYPMQLLDEIPIYYLILLGAWGFYERGPEPVCSACLPASLVAWAALVTCVLQATAQHDPVHQVFRGLMTCSFSVCFVYIFWAGARAARDNLLMSSLWHNAFLAFLVAIVSWIADNTACDALQSLRWYPNLHAWGWHCGSGGAMYLMFLALLVQRQEVRGIDCEVQYVWRFIPVVRRASGLARPKAS